MGEWEPLLCPLHVPSMLPPTMAIVCKLFCMVFGCHPWYTLDGYWILPQPLSLNDGEMFWLVHFHDLHVQSCWRTINICVYTYLCICWSTRYSASTLRSGVGCSHILTAFYVNIVLTPEWIELTFGKWWELCFGRRWIADVSFSPIRLFRQIMAKQFFFYFKGWSMAKGSTFILLIIIFFSIANLDFLLIFLGEGDVRGGSLFGWYKQFQKS